MDGLIFIILIAVMWAVLLIPQQRRVKRQKELLATIGVGDDVMTSGGIYGTITGEEDGDVFLLISTDVEIRVARGAIANKVEFEDDDETGIDEVDHTGDPDESDA